MAENSLPNPELPRELHEFFASGYFERPADSPMQRWFRGVRRCFEYRTLSSYQGELLYPCGPTHHGDDNQIVRPSSK